VQVAKYLERVWHFGDQPANIVNRSRLVVFLTWHFENSIVIAISLAIYKFNQVELWLSFPAPLALQSFVADLFSPNMVRCHLTGRNE